MTSTATAHKPIAPVDLAAERASLGPALHEAVLRTLDSGKYVLGPEVEALERDFAKFHGVAHGIAVGTGTDALWLGLLAIGVKPCDDVVTSPFTFFASAASIALMGARPVLADVDLETALLDPSKARAAITPRTTCILPVHLYGQLADMQAFRALCDEKKLLLLEDGAQAHGSRRDGAACGTLGDAGTFSFYVTKNLGAAGEGGMVLTQSGAVAKNLRGLRDHGSPAKYVHARIGTNSRLQAIQAAILNVKLPHLERWNERRRANAARYDRNLAGHPAIGLMKVVPGAYHTYHQYTVRMGGERTRDAVLADLAAEQIFAGVHYPSPVHLQEAAKPWGYGPGDFPNAERLAREVLCLPVHPFLSDADIDRVSEVLRRVTR